jgi:hypothetical protein
MGRSLELGERRWVGIVTMSANKLGLEATLRPVGRPRKPTVPVVRLSTHLSRIRRWPMTVRREQTHVIQEPYSKVTEAIRSVLSQGIEDYSYRHTVEADDHLVFNTVIRPSSWPLMLATKMAISLEPEELQTKVTVRTRSQWFLLGDFFDFYRGYIYDFLEAIRRRLDQKAEGSIASTKAVAAPFAAREQFKNAIRKCLQAVILPVFVVLSCLVVLIVGSISAIDLLEIGSAGAAEPANSVGDVIFGVWMTGALLAVFFAIILLILYVKKRARAFGLVCPRCDTTFLLTFQQSLAVATGRCGRCGLRLFPEDEP